MRHTLFLKWWLIWTLIVVGSVFGHLAGLTADIYQKDSSFISFGILALFYGMSAWCGYKTWIVSKHRYQIDRELAHSLTQQEEMGWFASEACLTLGMIGTVVGFIMMLSEFDKIDVTQQSTLQGFIGHLGAGMATALYTTLVGLICGLILKLQYFNMGQALESAKRVETDGDPTMQYSECGNLDIFYAHQFCHNETTSSCKDSDVSIYQPLEHGPVLKGTVTGTLYVGSTAIQTFLVQSDGAFHVSDIGTPPIKSVEGSSFDHEQGLLKIQWNAVAPENHAVVSYEYNIGCH